MCGFVGFLSLEKHPGVAVVGLQEDHALVEKMLQKIASRGPDGQGFWHDEHIHLGHCRLSIIDLSTNSDQPFRLEDDRFVIVFNGEIYNYKTLRRELESAGEAFFSQGDTEVLLRGFARYGTPWFKRLNGMFAGAIWDKAAQTLTLFRDRFGIKPLYWCQTAQTVLFASQIKSLQEHPAFKSRLSLTWLNEYLTFQNAHGSLTPFEGVALLEPGHALQFHVGDNSSSRVCWMPSRRYEPDFKMTAQSGVEDLSVLFKQSVERALVSDVPIGSYLSGGIDSGAITAIASQQASDIQTFTCGFDDPTLPLSHQSVNEIEIAEKFAGALGLSHHKTLVNPLEALSRHHAIFYTLEEPRVGMLYQNDAAAELAGSQVKVCLSGAGGDELFGGYPWRYRMIRHAQTREAFLNQYYAFWQRVFRDEEKKALWTPDTAKYIDDQHAFRTFSDYFEEEADYTDIGARTWRCLHYESRFFLHGLLQIGDRLAGAYGLEERFPFLDNDLVAYVDTIPANFHWNADEDPAHQQFHGGKRLLREVLSRYVPSEFSSAKKQGFVLPEAEWYRGCFSQFIRRELYPNTARITQYIQPTAVSRIVEEHESGQQDHRFKLWSLLSVEAILKTLFV